jgi:two-component system sensor histidine kinase RegB
MPLSGRSSRPAVTPLWLLTLRWVAVVGQLVTIAGVRWLFDVEIRLAPLLSIVGVTAATNLACDLYLRRIRRRGDTTQATGQSSSSQTQTRFGTAQFSTALFRGQTLFGLLMALDLLSLTGLLYFTGGPSNPFAIFYFVNLALAAVVLPSRWAWSLTAMAIVCFCALFIDHVPLQALDQVPAGSPGRRFLNLQQVGLLAAFTACMLVINRFITRINEELHARDAQLRLADERRAKSERFESLATLAAGAGHELASPLSTIAVAAGELTRHLEGANVAPTVREDLSLIRSELAHCRSILDRLAGTMGQAVGGELTSVEVPSLIDDVVAGLRHSERVRVRLDYAVREKTVVAPMTSLSQAVRGLVQNALDASEPLGIVDFTAGMDGDQLRLEVADRGPGMPPDVLARAGEPFFTTKEPGRGMGLGLFLTRSVVERLGGTLELTSAPHQGTTAIIRLPCA